MSKLYERAAEAVKKRNYDYAIELFLQELTLDPNNVDARRALRAAEIKKFQEAGQPTSGWRAYLQGLPTVLRAQFHKLTKNWERLMLDCEEFLKRAPRDPRFLAMLGDAAVAAGHTDAAIVAYEELREADRESAHALRGLGRLYRDKGDLGRALAYYEQLKKQFPTDPEAAKAVRDLAAAGATRKVEEAKAAGGEGTYRDLIKDKQQAADLEAAAHRLRTETDVDAAIARLERELEKGEDPKVLKQIGDLYAKKKEWDEAISYYERSLEKKRDPIVADALGDLRIRRFDEEIEALAEAAKRGEANAKARLKDAKDRRNALCIEEYQRRVAERPTELGLRFQLGQFLYKADRYDEAIAELQKAVGDPRRGTQARLFLGKCFAAKGLFEQAIKQLEKAREGTSGMDELGKEITYNLGLIHERAGRKDKATAEFEKIIEVDINYRDALKRMEALKA